MRKPTVPSPTTPLISASPLVELRRVVSEIAERNRKGEDIGPELLEDLRRQARASQELNRKAREAYPELQRMWQQIEADAQAWLNRLNRPGRPNQEQPAPRIRSAWAPDAPAAEQGKPDDAAGAYSLDAAEPPIRRGRGRGPAPMDPGTLRRFAEIVYGVAPDRNWRSKLDDIRYALAHGCADSENCDEKHAPVPLPRGWAEQTCSWMRPPGTPELVKAIKYRLKLASRLPQNGNSR